MFQNLFHGFPRDSNKASQSVIPWLCLWGCCFGVLVFGLFGVGFLVGGFGFGLGVEGGGAGFVCIL